MELARVGAREAAMTTNGGPAGRSRCGAAIPGSSYGCLIRAPAWQKEKLLAMISHNIWICPSRGRMILLSTTY